MISILGNLSLWLALLFGIYQLLIPKIGIIESTQKKFEIAVKGLFFCVLMSFVLLMYAHVTSDFSILNVYQNSHSTKPLIYKIAGVWGNHEGSMLLWIFVLALFNYFIFNLYNQKNSYFISSTLQNQSFITIGFILFTILLILSSSF